MDFSFGTYHLPEFKYPEGLDAHSWFEKLCRDGFARRYPEAPRPTGSVWSTRWI